MEKPRGPNIRLRTNSLLKASAIIKRLSDILSGSGGSYLDYHVRFLDRLEKHAKSRWTQALPPLSNPATIEARVKRRGYYKAQPAADATPTSRFYWTGRLLQEATGATGMWSTAGKDGSKLIIGPEDGKISDNVKRALDTSIFSQDKLEAIADDAANQWIGSIVRKLRV